MRERNGAGAGGVPSTAEPASGTVNVEADSPVYANRTPASQAEIQSVRRARIDAARQHIAALSELFPACIVADKWETHRPLKVGMHADLLATGLLTPREVRNALVVYTGRLQYQRALAAGGARFDLDGNAVGEVAADEIEHARAVVAQMEAKAAAKADVARAEKAERKRAARQAKMPPKTSAPDSPTPRRLGISDLKRAAVERRNGGPS